MGAGGVGVVGGPDDAMLGAVLGAGPHQHALSCVGRGAHADAQGQGVGGGCEERPGREGAGEGGVGVDPGGDAHHTGGGSQDAGEPAGNHGEASPDDRRAPSGE